jgi:hypothetical protein
VIDSAIGVLHSIGLAIDVLAAERTDFAWCLLPVSACPLVIVARAMVEATLSVADPIRVRGEIAITQFARVAGRPLRLSASPFLLVTFSMKEVSFRVLDLIGGGGILIDCQAIRAPHPEAGILVR